MLTSVAVFQIMLNVGFFLSEQHNRRVARQNMSTMRSVGTSNSNAALLPSKPVPARNPTSQVAALTAVTVLIIVLLLLLSVWHITAVMSAKIAMTSDTAESHSYLPSHVLRSTPSPDATYYYATTGDVHNLSYAGGFFSDAALTRPVSTWHDIPLYTNQRAAANIDRDSIPIHFVCEVRLCVFSVSPSFCKSQCYNFVQIPRLTRIKFEMNKADSLNRIMPDRDKQTNQLRVNLHGDYQVNYGMLPQTFSDPKLLASGTKFRGDGDPIDALELGMLYISSSIVSIVQLYFEFGFRLTTNADGHGRCRQSRRCIGVDRQRCDGLEDSGDSSRRPSSRPHS
jgi:hypothetical protein